jgi:hypothetical protein
VLVTLQRLAKARGYFAAKRFTGRIEETVMHELAMNLDGFTGLAPMKASRPPSHMKWRTFDSGRDFRK